MAIDEKLASEVSRELKANKNSESYWKKKITSITPKGFILKKTDYDYWYIGQDTGKDIYGLASYTSSTSLKKLHEKLETFIKPFK